ncbi:SDR family NAD(P)-dependent oxidoreductase [Ruegeria sp. R13_0]|uniref:SDR family NAD(P)-dependent oxidoreductase n=1 Tax=Ruegeria sp. R13_0 TaxID=2821099 RepID=UPI001ADADAA7|nr:SDR family NAD(P)-dependent oxidoreductase [Ruegeria sp. R13_0]MBO9436659.1 SDR family NAD(P)-dependent oxidoreductase [Ruegeria sp. R13_0]
MISDVANWTVITGSTGGIGGAIAQILASRGDPLVLLNRSEPKARAQREQILAEFPDQKIELITADLMETEQVFDAIGKINALPGRVATLYNNSGVLTGEKVLNDQGIEMHFAVNVLAPYLLTLGLREKMARPSGEVPAMVVNMSSSAVSSVKSLNLENITNPETVSGLMGTYAQTKLAVTALAPAMADELKQHNILIRAIDPGATKTAMTTTGNSGMPTFLRWLAPILFSPAEKQAAKVIAAADPAEFGGATGIFVANLKEKKVPKSAADPNIQRALLALLEAFRSTA